MSKKTRKKDEEEDCGGRKRVVMSGSTSGGFKIFSMLPLSFPKADVSISEAPDQA